MKKTKLVKSLLVILLTVVLLFVLLSQIDIKDIFNTLSRFSLYSFLIVAVFLSLIYFLKAIRYNLLIRSTIPSLFNVAALHSLYRELLPANTGELSYFYFMKKNGVKVADSIVCFITVRVLDFITVALIFFVSILFIGPSSLYLRGIVYLVGIVLLLAILFLFLLISKGEKFIGFLRGIRGISKFKLMRTLLSKSEEVARSFSVIKPVYVLFIFLYSLVIWSVNYTLLVFIAYKLGVMLPFMQIAFSFVLLTLFNILPIRSFASFGTTEGILSLAFISFGITKQIAIASSFGVHIVMLAATILIGLVVYMLYFSKKP